MFFAIFGVQINHFFQKNKYISTCMRKYKYLYFQIQKSQFLLLSLLKTPKVHKYLSTCYFEYMGNIFPQKYTKNRFFKLLIIHTKSVIKAKRVVMERRHICMYIFSCFFLKFESFQFEFNFGGQTQIQVNSKFDLSSSKQFEVRKIRVQSSNLRRIKI